MQMTFKDRFALITGAGRGIGKRIAEYIANEGVTVICVSRNDANCNAVADRIVAAGGKAVAKAVDVSDAAAVEKAAKGFLEEYSRIDIIVNCAGITRDGLLLRMSNDDWDSVLRTNLSSCFYWARHLVHPMARNRWGRVVNISSVVGLMGNAGQINYASAKAGMIGFTKSLAKEFASRSVTVNAIAPGYIETDMTSGIDDRVAEHILKAIPLRRIGQTDDIARMVTYLCSEEANYITGQVFTVDGGMVM